jgi:hypothetical protein
MEDILEFLKENGFEVIIEEDLAAIEQLSNDNYEDLLCLPDDINEIQPPEVCIEPPTQVDEPEVPVAEIPSSTKNINGCIDRVLTDIKTYLSGLQISREMYGIIDEGYENYLVLRAKISIYFYLLINKIDNPESKAGIAIIEAIQTLIESLSGGDYLNEDEQLSNPEILALIDEERTYYNFLIDTYRDGSFKNNRVNLPNAKSLYENITTRIMTGITNRVNTRVVSFVVLTENNYKPLESGAVSLIFSIDQDKLSDIEYINNLSTTRADSIRTSINAINEAVEVVRVGSRSFYKSVVKDNNLKTLLNAFLGLAKELDNELNMLINTYVNIDTAITEARINAIIKAKDCTKGVTFDVPSSIPATIDLNHRTFSNASLPSLLDIGYWVRYSNLLTIVNLIPAYWPVGIIVPTPGGPVPINLPVIWRPIFVNYTPPIVNVLFMTINGIVVFPVLWQLRMEPIASEASVLVTLPRGANVTIKTGTGSQAAGIQYNNNIDINPSLSRTLPITKDDLPSYERLSIDNGPLLVYLNQWLSKARPSMGLI